MRTLKRRRTLAKEPPHARRYTDPHAIDTLTALEALYGTPPQTSLRKEVDHVHPVYRALIEASPFVALATSGPEGLDVSPRGDAPGFVTVQDDKTLLLPARPARPGRGHLIVERLPAGAPSG